MNTTTNAFAILDEICKFQRPATAKSKIKWVSKPYWRRGFLYATDGVIMVRVPCEKIDARHAYGDFVSRKAAPPVGSWMEPVLKVAYVATPIKTRQYESMMKCGCENPNYCGRCINGVVPIYRSVEIQDCEPKVHYGAWYLAILARHSVASLDIADGGIRYECPARFKGDGFEGILMPFSKDKD